MNAYSQQALLETLGAFLCVPLVHSLKYKEEKIIVWNTALCWSFQTLTKINNQKWDKYCMQRFGIGGRWSPPSHRPRFLKNKKHIHVLVLSILRKDASEPPPPNKNANVILNPIHALHQLQYSDDVVEHKYDSKCKIGNKIYTPEM